MNPLSMLQMLPFLMSLLGRNKPNLENPIKDVIDIIGTLPPQEQEEQIKPIDIAEAQKMLAALGYDPGSVDGKAGPRTREATKQFQEANGLDPDGLIGQKTWSKLLGEYESQGHA
jgi:murein L,D-transpeptidase YcbB/YkuD